MRTCARLFALPLLLLTLAAPAAADQKAPRTVGLFADSAGNTAELFVTGFIPFLFHAVGFELDGQVKGWELSVQIDPDFTVLTRTLDQPSSLNVGNGDNFIVGSGGCFVGSPSYVFVTYNVGYFAGPVAPNDAAVCLGPVVPSSFSPATPGYLQCDGTLVPLELSEGGCCGLYPDGCLVINGTQCIIGTASSSFGEVKSRF